MQVDVQRLHSTLLWRNWIFTLSLFIFHQLFDDTIRVQGQQPPVAKVPAVFAFGDSMVDPGNNNHLLTLGRANFYPYGKNFKDKKATGRFSDGKIPSDFLTEQLGVKEHLPAYLDQNLSEEDLLTGVSFASAGTGYDPKTSEIILVKSMEDQLKMFNEYIGKVSKIVGTQGTNSILNNSMFFVAAGGCDLANTYFTVPFLRRHAYDIDAYTDLMIDFATMFFKKLYRLGARKIGVTSLPPIAHLPAQRTLGGGPLRECPKVHDQAARLFNIKLQEELQYLTSKFTDAKFVYMDLYSVTTDLIFNGTLYGFEVVDKGCCGSGLIEGAILCNPFSWLCKDEKYLFWDSFHPTERAYKIMVEQIAQKYFPLFF